MHDDSPAVPLWLDIVLLLVWFGVVAACLIGAVAMANVFMGVAILGGGGALLFALRTLVKKYRAEWA